MGEKRASVDLKEDAVYIVVNGVLEKADKPSTGYGKSTVIWQNDVPIRTETYTTKQLCK